MTAVFVRRVSAMRAAIYFPFDRYLLDLVKNRVPGTTWEPEFKRWTVPTGNLKACMRELRKAGCTFEFSEGYLPELIAREARLAVVPDWLFADDVPAEQWVQPPGVVTEPRGYQKADVMALACMQDSSLIASAVGAGKTYEVLCDIMRNGWFADGPNSVLYLTRARLRQNVLEDFMQHLGLIDPEATPEEVREAEPRIARLVTLVGLKRNSRGRLVPASKAERALQWAEPTPIKIGGYESYLQYDWQDAPKHWLKVYADEITSKVKNFRTGIHERLALLGHESAHGITGMTATPIEIKVDDFFQTMDVIAPGLLGRWPQFAQDFLNLDEWGRPIGGVAPHRLSAFWERIGPYVIRRTREQVRAQWPKKRPSKVIDVLMTTAEQTEYDALAKDFMKWLIAHPAVTGSATDLVQLLRLRQYADCPRLADPASTLLGSKVETAIDLVHEADEKVVIFTQWAGMAKILHEVMDSYVITGDTPQGQGQDIVRRFNGDSMPVLIATDAMAYGFNITGASITMHYDQLWNPAKMDEQREGRLERGKARELYSYTPICQNTFEVWMRQHLNSLRAQAEHVYSGREDMEVRHLSARQWAAAVAGERMEV